MSYREVARERKQFLMTHLQISAISMTYGRTHKNIDYASINDVNVETALAYYLDNAILTTNLAACVCQCAKYDQFLPVRYHFGSKRPENFVRIAKFLYAAVGPLFAFHCPLFFYEKQ